MTASDQEEFTRAAALCVNYALDSVEVDIRNELGAGSDQTSQALFRLLEKLKKRRINADVLAPVCAPQ